MHTPINHHARTCFRLCVGVSSRFVCLCFRITTATHTVKSTHDGNISKLYVSNTNVTSQHTQQAHNTTTHASALDLAASASRRTCQITTPIYHMPALAFASASAFTLSAFDFASLCVVCARVCVCVSVRYNVTNTCTQTRHTTQHNITPRAHASAFALASAASASAFVLSAFALASLWYAGECMFAPHITRSLTQRQHTTQHRQRTHQIWPFRCQLSLSHHYMHMMRSHQHAIAHTCTHASALAFASLQRHNV
jgi:hypothetical protein